MKTLITFAAITFCLYIKAQDTLYFPSGEIQLVELISLNKEAGLIKYKLGEKTQIRSITTLKSYSNHANVSDGNWTLGEGTVESDTAEFKINRSSHKDPSKYTYGKFSIGANLISCLSIVGYQYDFTIASNFNQSFYVQYNLNKQIGFRLPMRIGFNQIKDTTTIEEGGYSYTHNRELFGEGGFEVVFMLNDNRKITPYFMPGIYFGVNQAVISNYNDSIYSLSTYYPAPKHIYYRVGLTGGFQFNFSKYLQLNTELGFNYNNASIFYNDQYGTNTTPVTYYKHNQLGLQAAVNLVYRFGGRIRE